MTLRIGGHVCFFVLSLGVAGCAGDDGGDDDAADTAGQASSTAGDDDGDDDGDDGDGDTSDADTGGSGSDGMDPDTGADTASETTGGDGSDSTSDGGTGSESTGSTGAAALSYAEDIFPLFVAAECTECHSGGAPAAQLSLDDATQSYEDMIDVAAVAGQCPTQPVRVSPGSLTDSCMDVFLGNFLANGSMSQADVDLSRQWILEGAAP